MRLPEEQLRYPIELIQQGYEPDYLAMYRPDELGGIDVETMARLKRVLEYETSLAAHKEKVLATLHRDNQVSESTEQVIEECTSVSQVDAIVRSVRNKKNAKLHAEEFPYVEALGQTILMHQGDAPADLLAWVAQQTGVPIEDADQALQNTKRWLQLLLSEDPKLTLQLQRAVLNNAVVSLSILAEPAKGEDGEADVAGDGVATPAAPESKGASKDAEVEAIAPVIESSATDSEATIAEVNESAVEPIVDSVESIASLSTESPTEESATSDQTSGTTDALVTAETTTDGEQQVAGVAPSEVAPSAVAPLIEQFHKGRKQTKALKTKTLSDKQLSPRQRRRRWLRHILESYSRLKKPLRNLTPYQILMIARGIRSRIVELKFQQDLRPLVQACRESLCPNRHPMHGLLMQVSESALKELILPKLQQDAIAILEEDAHEELIEASVLHLQNNLLQRPLSGHRILMIDAVGIKTAAISIVDAVGNVIATSEIPCNSSKADVVSQNMSLLGQLVHQHRVTLVALSNGPTRKYLMPAVVELLKQSTDGSLYWTLVDRSGCDAYTQSRNSLVELPRISRRHRAAVWLAWRMQDPLRQILKIDPARLRLGSYQRELPQAELERALQESVSATIAKAGVDALSADVDVLKRIPGMTDEAARRVVEERQAGTITSRETLMKCLREVLTEMQARQAIGFLRVYGSSNTLDGTIIHPDDYRLAERLVAHAKFALPPAAPEGWEKPDYEKIAAARAAVAGMSIESVLADENDGTSISVIEPKVHINPDFGKMDDGQEISAESETPSESAPSQEGKPSVSVADEQTEASSEVVATSPQAIASEGSQETTAEESTSRDASGEVASTDEGIATAETSTTVASGTMPAIATDPMPRPSLSVDAEKLARSWQVGRAKLKSVAACLQFPFADVREFRYPVPLRSKVPSLDQLPQGTMLSGLVVGVADFGVFVELGPDCSGLIHISRLASDFVEDPHMFVQIGDVIPVWVVQVDEKRKRVAVNAISPGSAERKRETNDERSVDRDSGPANRNSSDRNSGQRPARGNERNDRSASGQAPRGGAPNNASSRSGAPRSNDSRSGGRDQGQRRGGQERGRGNFAGKGNANRDRNEGQANENQSANRKPLRIDKPQPQTPITEAMQQGKEPLRSFGDLVQFMQKSKTPEAVVSPRSAESDTPDPTAPVPVAASDSPSSEPSSSDTSGNGDMSEAGHSSSDASTTA